MAAAPPRDGATTPEQVVAAVHALYGGHGLAAQAAANTWLTGFQASGDAWRLPFALLEAGQPPEVLFFATTLLLRKVRGEWAKLDAPSRQGLAAAIRCAGSRGGRRRSGLLLRACCGMPPELLPLAASPLPR